MHHSSTQSSYTISASDADRIISSLDAETSYFSSHDETLSYSLTNSWDLPIADELDLLPEDVPMSDSDPLGSLVDSHTPDLTVYESTATQVPATTDLELPASPSSESEEDTLQIDSPTPGSPPPDSPTRPVPSSTGSPGCFLRGDDDPLGRLLLERYHVMTYIFKGKADGRPIAPVVLITRQQASKFPFHRVIKSRCRGGNYLDMNAKSMTLMDGTSLTKKIVATLFSDGRVGHGGGIAFLQVKRFFPISTPVSTLAAEIFRVLQIFQTQVEALGL